MRVVTHAVPWIAIPPAVILALRSLKSIASVNPVSGTLISVSTWFRQLPTIVGVTGVVKLATKVAMMSGAALAIARTRHRPHPHGGTIGAALPNHGFLIPDVLPEALNAWNNMPHMVRLYAKSTTEHVTWCALSSA